MSRTYKLASFLVALILSSPATSSALAQLTHASLPTPVELHNQALQNRLQQSVDRRAYQIVIAECARRVTAGEKITCPNINDEDAIRRFLRGESLSSASSASGKIIPVLGIQDVSDGDLALLRRYQRNGDCPRTLKDGKQAGFYELCLTFITTPRIQTQREQALKRLINQKLEGIIKATSPSSIATLDDRLKELPKGIHPHR